jgi:hypothetical protein
MHGQLLKVAVMEVRVALRNSTKVVPKLAKNPDYTQNPPRAALGRVVGVNACGC